MSAGETIEQAHKVASGACGRLALLLAKRRVSRSILESAAGDFEEAARAIRLLLTPTAEGHSLGVSNPENPGE